jgi:hypothetical protein
MKRIVPCVFAAVLVACVEALLPAATGRADKEASPVFGVQIPDGYSQGRFATSHFWVHDLADSSSSRFKSTRRGSAPELDCTRAPDRCRPAWIDLPPWHEEVF